MTTKTNLAQPSFNSTSWNTPLNSNFNITNLAFGETESVNVASGNVTLTATQAQNQRIAVTGSPGVARTVNLPNGVTGSWVITNGSNASVTIKSDGGGATGTAVASGYSATVFAAVSGASVEVFSAESDVIRKTGDTMVGTLNCASNGFTVGSTQLYVSGGNVYTSGNFFATSNVTAYNTSDERLKENIKTIEGAVEIVKKLRGVSFTSKLDSEEYIGVIAQEIQSVLPQLVRQGEEDDYLYVAYGNIVGVLINAIKELADRVERLEGNK